MVPVSHGQDPLKLPPRVSLPSLTLFPRVYGHRDGKPTSANCCQVPDCPLPALSFSTQIRECDRVVSRCRELLAGPSSHSCQCPGHFLLSHALSSPHLGGLVLLHCGEEGDFVAGGCCGHTPGSPATASTFSTGALIDRSDPQFFSQSPEFPE